MRNNPEPGTKGISLERGVFILSLDFELIWGTLDLFGPEKFRKACQLERELIIDRLLGLLIEFGVPATWCIVGHLFLDLCGASNGVRHSDIVRPAHAWLDGDWFARDPGGDESAQPLFLARSIVEKIRDCPVGQEIGSHSFSHVIFGDHGCSRESAASELAACVRVAESVGVGLQSFAFPRNSVGHLDVIAEAGFRCYRGPEPVWYEDGAYPPALKRLGHLWSVVTAAEPPVVMPVRDASGLWNIPGSMIYFPMHGGRRFIPISVRVRRAVKGLEAAASYSRIFHLWFHPTNLCDEPGRMFEGLRRILEHANELRRSGRLEFRSMADVAKMAEAGCSEGGD